MREYSIQRCRGCGRLFRVYAYAVYRGDPNYCPTCNRLSGQPTANPPVDKSPKITEEIDDWQGFVGSSSCDFYRWSDDVQISLTEDVTAKDDGAIGDK